MTVRGTKMESTTLAHLPADSASAEPAIIAEDAAGTISHRALADSIERLAGVLRCAGLRPGDAVALVLPNGPERLVLFLALARARLIAAPLNPAYKWDELRWLFRDVGARAIVTTVGNGAVAGAAAGLGAPVWSASMDPSGNVSLAGIPRTSRGVPEMPDAEDVALVLHTSGTEGRPKVVPLTHTNVLRSAQHSAARYALTPADRRLNRLPLVP